MSDKLLVTAWGFSVSADGQLAIVAAVVIVIILVATLWGRRV